MTLPTQQTDDIIDVAIIGGGVSGAYTAYRLMTVDPEDSPVLKQLLEESGKNKLDIRLFEMSDRIGGRLWSINLEQEGLPRAEMGGMSFSRLQCNVYGLCKELGLKMEPSTLYADEYLQYFEDKRYWAFDYEEDHSQVPFTPTEQWTYPGDLLGEVFKYIMTFRNDKRIPFIDRMISLNKKLSNLSYGDEDIYINRMTKSINSVIDILRNAKLEKKSYHGFLHELDFKSAIEHILSIDGFKMIEKVADLHSIRGDWNLYDHCLLSMRSEIYRETYHTLKEGYDKLPQMLVNKFTKKEGSFSINYKLLKITKKEGEIFSLSFEGKPHEIRAKNIILALPKEALKAFYEKEEALFYEEKKLFNTVSPIPVYKLIFTYDDKWWDDFKYKGKPIDIDTGFSLTDQELQACYYRGWNGVTGLVIASLGDTHDNQAFWRTQIQEGDIYEKIKVKLDSKLVTTANKQLIELHKLAGQETDIPKPIGALFYDWTDAPFGGGWHLWKPNVKSWEVAKKIRKPKNDLNVFICGEAYSEQQGSVEGAINSAEMVLQEHFGFKELRPSWVPENYRFDV